MQRGEALAGAYRSVLGHPNTSLAGLRTSPDRSQLKEEDGKVKTVLQMLDILLVLAPYLPVVQKAEVVDIMVRSGVLDVSDGVCSGHEVGASLAAEKDHTISAGMIALSRVLFDFKSTLRHVRSMKVKSNYCLVKMTSRQSTPRRFSTLSIPFSLQEIVKLSRLSLVCVHSPSAEVVQPQLGDIVRGLIGCLTTHRVLKVRNPFNCLLRFLLSRLS